MKLLKKFYVQVVIIIIISGIVGWYAISTKTLDESSINSFQDCAAAGFPIMESYPEQCSTPGGKHFTRVIQEPKTVTISGETVCLPHKEKDGPQTLECAYGIRDASGVHYGVGFLDPSKTSSFVTGEIVTLTGELTEAGDTKYDIAGTIQVSDMTLESE